MTVRIRIDGLSVWRGATEAVRNISFGVEAASWVGLVGANGSGKTTLLRALSGRLPMQAGRIVIDGLDCSKDRAERARRIGLAPEAAMLPQDLTARELFAIVGGDGAAAAEDLGGLWDALALDRFADRRIGTLSDGIRQRIAIYSAFIGHSRGTVILDEPFNWLDPLTAYDSKNALRALVGRGLTLITALHDLATLTLQCDRGLLLADGALTHDLGPEQLALGKRDPQAFDRMIVEHLRPDPTGSGLRES